MNRDQKATAIAEIAAHIDKSQAILAVDYRGISVPQVAELRANLRDADATFKVVKNSLTERAADEAGAVTLKDFLTGPTALTFIRGDVTSIRRVATSGNRCWGPISTPLRCWRALRFCHRAADTDWRAVNSWSTGSGSPPR